MLFLIHVLREKLSCVCILFSGGDNASGDNASGDNHDEDESDDDSTYI